MREQRERWGDRLAEPRTYRAIVTGLVIVVVCGLAFVGVMAAQVMSSGDEPDTTPIRSAGQYVGRGLEVLTESTTIITVPATSTTLPPADVATDLPANSDESSAVGSEPEPSTTTTVATTTSTSPPDTAPPTTTCVEPEGYPRGWCPEPPSPTVTSPATSTTLPS